VASVQFEIRVRDRASAQLERLAMRLALLNVEQNGVPDTFPRWWLLRWPWWTNS
jgi:hypothetical protein